MVLTTWNQRFLAWVIGLSFLTPSLGFAFQTSAQWITDEWRSRIRNFDWSDQNAQCDLSGSDLKVSIGDIANGRIEILLRDYANHRNETQFKIDPASNGEVRILIPNSDGVHFQNWVYGDSSEDCVIFTKRVNEIDPATQKPSEKMAVWGSCKHLSQDKDGEMYHNLEISETNSLSCANSEKL
jgi:hypothetical protein